MMLALTFLTTISVASSFAAPTRREWIGAAVVATTVPFPVVAEQQPSEEATMTTKKLSQGSIRVPSTWQDAASTLSDPILGDVAKSFAVHSSPCDIDSIDQAGRIDTFRMAALGLEAGRERGDIVNARRRTDDSGRLFYEWDLAVSPLVCPKEQQLVVTTCLPDEVVLVSATVSRGSYVVYECAVSPPQWKNFAKALRDVRSSFSP